MLDGQSTNNGMQELVCYAGTEKCKDLSRNLLRYKYGSKLIDARLLSLYMPLSIDRLATQCPNAVYESFVKSGPVLEHKACSWVARRSFRVESWMLKVVELRDLSDSMIA